MTIVSALLAFAIAAALTPLVKRVARRAGLVAHPRSERWHRAPVPMLGGVGIVVAFTAATLITGDRAALWPLVACCGAMAAVGLLDDLLQLTPGAKFASQMAVAGTLLAVAPPFRLTGVQILDVLIVLTWVIGMTNAFNLLDNVDGLAAGVAAIAGLFFLVVLWSAAPGPLIPALGAFIGATVAFLVFNYQPASIFMGDSGSLFLGFFLAAVGLFTVPAQSGVASLAVVPVLILLVPVFDTTFVTLTRRMAGRSPLVGGRDHTSHRLIALGFGERRAVLVHYLLTAAGGVVALGILHASPGYVGIALGSYAIGLAALGVVLGHVESAHAQEGAIRNGPPPSLSEISYRNRALEVLLDAALVGLAYYAAFAIRFQDEEFARFLPYFGRSLPIVVVCQVAGLWIGGKYAQVWRSFGAAELTTIVKGVAVGVATSVIVVLYVYRFEGFSRLVFVFESIVLTALLIGMRVAVNRLDEYLLRQRGADRQVIVYGAGRRGALLVRDLLQASTFNLVPIGFLDDDPAKRRLRIEGLRVLGGVADLDAVLAKHSPSEVLVSTEHIDEIRLRHIDISCRARQVRVRRLRLALEDLSLTDLGEMARHG